VTNGNEIQTVTITGTPNGGTFTLTYDGAETATINHNANAATVATRLEALATIGAGNVAVTGGPGPGTPYVVQFIGDLARLDLPLMTADGALLTGGASPDAAVALTQTGGVTMVWDEEPDPVRVFVRNINATAVDLGGPDVVSGAGFSLPQNADVALWLDAGEVLHAIAASAAVEIQVLVTSAR